MSESPKITRSAKIRTVFKYLIKRMTITTLHIMKQMNCYKLDATTFFYFSERSFSKEQQIKPAAMDL